MNPPWWMWCVAAVVLRLKGGCGTCVLSLATEGHASQTHCDGMVHRGGKMPTGCNATCTLVTVFGNMLLQVLLLFWYW